MKIKFVTKYDYFLAILITCCFVFALLINRSIETIIIASILLILGIYKAFGKRITFSEENIVIRNLIFRKKIDYSDVIKVSYTTRLYGKSFITIFSSQKKHKASLNYTEWVKLKDWMEQKGIECVENR